MQGDVVAAQAQSAPLSSGQVDHHAYNTDMSGWHMGLENLTVIAKDLLGHLFPSRVDFEAMNACLKDLTGMSKQLGAEWSVRPFGSVASSLHTRLSDLDVTCFQMTEGGTLVTAGNALFQLLPIVQCNPYFEVIEVIHSARIPILKLRFNQQLDVDLSFQNTDPFQNTQLLSAYSRLSPGVRQLVTLVKIWAKAEGVCGAPEGHLSSYSFVLMVIYFLQVDPMIKMPCFPTDHFTGEFTVPNIAQISWWCPLALPSLMARFFDFFATQYAWGYEVVSIRTGTRQYVCDPVYGQLNSCMGSPMMQIEDPFILSRNLNCVLGWDQNSMLCNKLKSAINTIKMGSSPFGFVTALSWCQSMQGQSMTEDKGMMAWIAGPQATGREKALPLSEGSLGGDNPQSGTNGSPLHKADSHPAGRIAGRGTPKPKAHAAQAGLVASQSIQSSKTDSSSKMKTSKESKTKVSSTKPDPKALAKAASSVATKKSKATAALPGAGPEQCFGIPVTALQSELRNKDQSAVTAGGSQSHSSLSALQLKSGPQYPSKLLGESQLCKLPGASRLVDNRSQGQSSQLRTTVHARTNQEPPLAHELPLTSLCSMLTWKL